MPFCATFVAPDPLNYFLQHSERLRVSDIILRENNDPREVFAQAIRLGTGSKWSHSAIVYLLSEPAKGYKNIFLIEAKPHGIHIASWRNEVVPFDRFTVGIKRLDLSWYAETPYEVSRHEPRDPEDCHGIDYLRHVRGIAMDQINGLYDQKTIYELVALYVQRAAERHLGSTSHIAETAGSVADYFKKLDEKDTSSHSILRFICSGLVQYSFFEALRIRIANDLAIPEHREAALSNLSNMHRVIFRPDPKRLIPNYIQQVQAGKLNVADPAPEDVLDLLKTATPADFNNSENLQWCYVIHKGAVWMIKEAPHNYQPQSDDEAHMLEMLSEEHYSS